MKVLVAGIGNIFLGDDAFGVEVVQRMLRRPAEPAVHVEDFGIRGFDLAMRLDEAWDLVVLVDAAARGEPPGTLYVIEPDVSAAPPGPLEPHALDPATVLAMADRPARLVRLVACEPATFGSDDDPALELSPPVAAAIEPAIALIDRLVAQELTARA